MFNLTKPNTISFSFKTGLIMRYPEMAENMYSFKNKLNFKRKEVLSNPVSNNLDILAFSNHQVRNNVFKKIKDSLSNIDFKCYCKQIEDKNNECINIYGCANCPLCGEFDECTLPLKDKSWRGKE